MAAARGRPARPSGLLFLLCLALGTAVYYEVRSDIWTRVPPVAPPRSGAEVTLPAPLPEFRLPLLDDFAATVERPLFLPERRPPPPEEEAPEAPPQQAPLQVIVTGVVISEAGGFALVRREGESEVLRLAARDTIDGWSVKEVRANGVIFERDDDSLEVVLKDLAKPVPARRPEGRRPGPARETPDATQSRPEQGPSAPPTAGSGDQKGSDN